MRTNVLALMCVGLLGCNAGGPTQSPANQAIADRYPKQLLDEFGDYRQTKGYSIIAGCLVWVNKRVTAASGFQGYYIEAHAELITNPMNDLRYQALEDCKAKKDPKHDCTCEVLDENEVNMIVVP